MQGDTFAIAFGKHMSRSRISKPAALAPSSSSSSSSTAGRRFAPVNLSEARLDTFHNGAHQALSQTVKEFTKLDGKPVDPNRWGYLRSRGDVSVYHDRRPFSEQLSSLLVAGTINARLADVMEGLYADNSHATRMVQHMLNARFMDAEVLQVVEQRSVDTPYAFTGLKWAMVKAASGGIVSNRDLCYLEKLGTINIAGGRKLGYFIMQSVDLPECPPPTSSKVVRAQISLCYLMEELADNTVGVYMIGSMESQGPKFMVKMVRNAFADIALSFSNAVDVARTKRLARLMRAKPLPSQSALSSRTITCEICHCVPSLFDHTQECAGCNRTTVCKRCRTKCDVFRREHESSTRLEKAVFCRHCVLRASSPMESKPGAPSTKTKTKTRTKEEQPQHHEDDDNVLDSSFATVSEDDTDNENQLPASQRSLRRFSLKLLQQLEDEGYTTSSASSRLTGLSALGSGHSRRAVDASTDLTDDEADEQVVFYSPMSTASDYTSDDCGYDDEDIISIRPLRRSLQPPEMLEAPTGHSNSRRQRPYMRAYTDAAQQRDLLLSRLVQASHAAEHTFQITKEQTKLAQRVFERSRCKTRA